MIRHKERTANGGSTTNLVLDGFVVSFLEPGAEDDRVIGVTHRTQHWRRRIRRVVGERKLGDELSQKSSEGAYNKDPS